MLLARASGALGLRVRGAVIGVCVACAPALPMACGGQTPVVTAEPPEAGGSTADALAVESGGDDAESEFADAGAPGADALDAADPLVVIPAAFTEENAPMRILHNGDAIDLIRAPQGGHVVLLAAQVRNMSTSAANIRVRVRRPETGFIVAEEKRTVAMVAVPGEGDTMQPDLRSRSQVAHVPLCPDYDPVDIVAQALDVEIEVTALYTAPPRVGSTRILLVPGCQQTAPADEALCRCECAANYALGKCANDAGAPRSGQGSENARAMETP